MDKEKLTNLLNNELGYLPANNAIEILLELGRPQKYSRCEVIVGVGKMVPDIFIVNRGIVRFVDMNGDRERTFGFALPGTIFM